MIFVFKFMTSNNSKSCLSSIAKLSTWAEKINQSDAKLMPCQQSIFLLYDCGFPFLFPSSAFLNVLILSH